MKLSFFNIFLIVMITAFYCGADMVQFTNGDRLTGVFLRYEEGKIVFKSEVLGEVKLDPARIVTFTSEEPAEIYFQDGTMTTARIEAGEAGRITIAPLDLVTQRTISLSDFTKINPTPPPPPKWTGNVSAGLSASRGNTFENGANLSATALLRRAKDRIKTYVNVLAAQSKGGDGDMQTTEGSFTVGGQYDYFFTEKFYGFANLRYRTDHVANLDYRLLGGLGAGYQWVESKKLNFSTDIGVAEVCEQYTDRVNEDLNGDGIAWDKEITRSSEVSLQAGYHFDWAINNVFSFHHNTRYYPAFSDFTDFLLTSDAEIRAKLTKNLFANFQTLLEYDSTPGKDSTYADTKYILGIGYNF
ncbi:MAG: DUF481 domain-containing protein [Sedimentisphaerales bacterium]|nr:DUF481 domain-containing protein [Sedimentisphaerales bacterium]